MDKTKKRGKILAKCSLMLCSLAILLLAAAAGAAAGGGITQEVYAMEMPQNEPDTDTRHEQRVLARTVGEEDEPENNEWGWEISSDTSESLLDVVTDDTAN